MKKERTDKVMVNEDCRQTLKTERNLQSFFLKIFIQLKLSSWFLYAAYKNKKIWNIRQKIYTLD